MKTSCKIALGVLILLLLGCVSKKDSTRQERSFRELQQEAKGGQRLAASISSHLAFSKELEIVDTTTIERLDSTGRLTLIERRVQHARQAAKASKVDTIKIRDTIYLERVNEAKEEISIDTQEHKKLETHGGGWWWFLLPLVVAVVCLLLILLLNGKRLL